MNELIKTTSVNLLDLSRAVARTAAVIGSGDDERARLIDWGFFHLTIPEAAELAVIDMWVNGEIPEVEEPDDFMGDANDPRLKSLLENEINQLTGQIVKSVSAGLLRPDLVIRDMDDRIIPERAYISFDSLRQWLEERDYAIGEVGYEWCELQTEKLQQLLSDAAVYRAASEDQLRALRTAKIEAEIAAQFGDDESEGELELAYRAAIVEIDRLKKVMAERGSENAKKPSRVDRPLLTRQRRTLLTIIAALCDYSAINPNERGAAAQIAAMTDEIGASVGAETIGGLLKEIPEALETRMK